MDLRGVPIEDLPSRLPRPEMGGDSPTAVVRQVIEDVRLSGDQAVMDYTERWDGFRPDPLLVPADEIANALAVIPADLRRALELAATNIEAHHRSQLRPDRTETRDGVTITEYSRPVKRAGCYAPGGRAKYPSTVLMTAVPARVAGVKEIVLTVPAGRDGRIPLETLAAASVAGVDEVYRIGGAQAVAAMAYGTETIRPVDVIVGPGNQYVATAKREVAGKVGIPSAFAGPSEVVVVTDGSVPPDWAAIDVILQAEHGPDGLAWLICWDEAVADAINESLTELVEASPRAPDIEATLADGGYAVVCDGPEQAMAVSNWMCPEHLELLTADYEPLLAMVENAPAVFCGPLVPASIGDYIAGPNHTLPTFGTARFASPLGVADFRKETHVIAMADEAFDRLAPHVAVLADAEGLPAHADSVRIRQSFRREASTGETGAGPVGWH